MWTTFWFYKSSYKPQCRQLTHPNDHNTLLNGKMPDWKQWILDLLWKINCAFIYIFHSFISIYFGWKCKWLPEASLLFAPITSIQLFTFNFLLKIKSGGGEPIFAVQKFPIRLKLLWPAGKHKRWNFKFLSLHEL